MVRMSTILVSIDTSGEEDSKLFGQLLGEIKHKVKATDVEVRIEVTEWING